MGTKHQSKWDSRVAAFAASSVTTAPAPRTWEPDLSKINRNVHDADDEAREMRLRAKAINFTCTFVARGLLLAMTAYWLLDGLQSEGMLDRKRALAVLVQLGDLGRVFNKMMTPGTK